MRVSYNNDPASSFVPITHSLSFFIFVFLCIALPLLLFTIPLILSLDSCHTIYYSLFTYSFPNTSIFHSVSQLTFPTIFISVVVRKLKAAGDVPTDKKVLREFIQNVARELVKDVLGETAADEVKYASTLYAFIDPTKKDNQKGLIPPFKIGFKTKDTGVRFREEAVKKAKQQGSRLASTYFTHCQSSATRIRVMLLWAIVDVLKSTNPEIWVSQNASRPTLQIKENGRVKSYTYVKAMNEFGGRIAKKAIDDATKVAKRFFSGQLKKTFIVLND